MSSDSFHDAYWLLAVVPVGCSTVQVHIVIAKTTLVLRCSLPYFRFSFFSCARQQEKNDSPPILIFV